MDVNLFEEIKKDALRLVIERDVNEQTKILMNVFDNVRYLEYRVNDLEKELKTKDIRLMKYELER